MKYFIYLIIFVFTNCNISDVEDYDTPITDSIVYANKTYKMVLYAEKGMIKRFKLYNVENGSYKHGKAELITIDGKIPEGTNRIDHNLPNDYKGYECDSSYQSIENDIKIAFAIEKNTKQRLDLSLYDSNIDNFKDSDHTLLLQREH